MKTRPSIFRLKGPDLPQTFKVPGGAYPVPGLSTLVCGATIFSATSHPIDRLVIWMAFGLLFYSLNRFAGC
ncbi:MAG: hypothetical protein EOO38_17785 [Cytophagaceae bacterium]|nr:MAG: hypothetical protein EOO38_17785 [Cytophagaceae bacterium]